MKNLLLILFLNFTYNCLAQSVLNGSFEDNLFNGYYCSFDVLDYNEKMQNISAFHSIDNNDLFNAEHTILAAINEGCVLSGITPEITFGEAPPDGLWYTAIYSEAVFLEDNSFFSN